MAALSLQVSPTPCWHLQAHLVSFAPAGGRRHPGQQGHHHHCPGWHHRDGTGGLSKQGWPSRGRGTAVPCGPSAPAGLTGASCAGGTLPLGGGCLEGDTCHVCPMHLSQCARLLFFQDHGTKAGKGAAPSTDLRSLSPVRGTWCHQPGQAGEGSPVGLGVGGTGPTGPRAVFPALAPG